LDAAVAVGVYVTLSFARPEVPEGAVKELADMAWLVMADKPMASQWG